MANSLIPTTVVFGAAGFIGRHLLSDLLLQNPHTLGVARVAGNGLSSFDLAKPDISALELKRRRVTRAIIAAATSGISTCEKNPAATRQVNVEGTVALGRQLTEEGIRVMVFSSDYVFDGNSGDYDENSAVNPLNEYGRQKAEMESRLLEECGANALVVRLSKVYDTVKGSDTLLDEMAAKLVRGEPILAARDQFFCPTFVDDLVNVVKKLLTSEVNGILHLCAKTKTSRFALAQKVALTFRCDDKLVREISLYDLKERFMRPLDTSMVCPRLAETCPYEFRSLQESIEEINSYYASATRTNND